MSPRSRKNTQLFRGIAANPGLLCLDEAESFTGEAGENLAKLLRNGYNDTGSVERVDKPHPDLPWENIAYEVYSPKALSSIAVQNPVLASRCIVIKMSPSLKRIPPFRIKTPENATTRNELYRWAMSNASDVAQAYEDWTRIKHEVMTPDIRNRQWEIAAPFFAITEAIARTDLHPTLITFFTNYFKSAAELSAGIDRQLIILRALPSVIRTCHPAYGDWFYLLKDIHAAVLDDLEADEADKYKSGSVAKALRNMNFEYKKVRLGATYRLDPAYIADRMARKEIVPYDEDANWLNEIPSRTETPQEPEQYDWLNEYPTEVS